MLAMLFEPGPQNLSEIESSVKVTFMTLTGLSILQ